MTLLRCMQVLPGRSKLTTLVSYSLAGPDRSQIASADRDAVAVQTTVLVYELCE